MLLNEKSNFYEISFTFPFGFLFSDSGTGDFAASFTGNHGNAFSYGKTSKGIETVMAWKLLSRMKSFSNIDLTPVHSIIKRKNENNKYDDNEDYENCENDDIFNEFYSNGILINENRMVEKDVFGYISRISGLSLTVSDLNILSDCTDCCLMSERINVTVIFDCLKSNNTILSKNSQRDKQYQNYEENENENNYEDGIKYENENYDDNSLNIEFLSESALFALKHISNQIWRTADVAKR